MGRTITFACPDGSEGTGYLAEGEGATAGVVVLQEWWGLNDQIRGVAERFAVAGYTALAPDLYDGRVTGDPDEAGHMMEGLDWVGATEVEVRGALQHLKVRLPKAVCMGFCMGGALTVIAAAKLAECDAAVCYYGIPPRDQANPGDVRVPFQGHFANDDDWCTPAAVDEVAAAMAAGGVNHEIHRYDAAHAFFNETVDAYDTEAAVQSWTRTLAFLRTSL
jgi:carboxymethylenebutenolidase